MNKYIRIRRQGGSLYLRLPPDFVHENGLREGDYILWEPENFKLIRETVIEAAAETVVVSEMAEVSE